MLAAMGATPVGMPVPQVPEALSKGVIDGAVIPYQVAPSLKVHELTGFAAETDPSFPAVYTTVFILPMNKAKYESLPADLKAVIDKNSGRELSATLGRQQAADDIPGRKAFTSQPNYKISMIPAAELQRWKEKTAEQDDAWIKDMNKRGLNGQAMFNDAQALIKQYTK
jgi:TRAP-type transport system periplasmic protein